MEKQLIADETERLLKLEYEYRSTGAARAKTHTRNIETPFGEDYKEAEVCGSKQVPQVATPPCEFSAALLLLEKAREKSR